MVENRHLNVIGFELRPFDGSLVVHMAPDPHVHPNAYETGILSITLPRDMEALLASLLEARIKAEA